MPEAPGKRRQRGIVAFVGALACLPAFTNVRVGSFQAQDVVLLLLLVLCVARFLYRRLSCWITPGLKGLFKSYVLLLLVLAVFSILSVRLPFYSLFDVSFLKQPVIYSLSKLVQFSAVVCGFLWLTNRLMSDKKMLTQAMTIYWITGVACSAYALVCCIALPLTHLQPTMTSTFGAYYSAGIRARAFFNEGGPFGTYLVSVFIIGFLRRHVSKIPMGRVNFAIVLAAFVMADSKAGMFAAAMLLLYFAVSAASFARKVLYFAISITVLSAMAMFLNVGNQLNGYLYSYQNLDQQVAVRGKDMNLVAGRVAALYIVPKMIAAHPISGIGFGNYPLMRNDPNYLGILPSIRQAEDIPGIGIPGIAAEMGVPATLWLLVLLVLPAWRSRKMAAILSIAAFYQLMAHTFAVQLTFFYPWFVSACAIAAANFEPLSRQSERTIARRVRAAA